MKKKIFVLLSTALLTSALISGCGNQNSTQETEEATQIQTDADAAETEAVTASDETETAILSTEEETAQEETTSEEAQAELPDGVYTADFNTDNSMFHVSEACNGKGTLTVKDGKMTIHVSLASKKILNLYPGLAEDARKDGAELLQPTVDTVTYSDGMTEEVNGFDIPVPVLDEEFDVALVGTKGTWYDHKVSVSNPEKVEE